MWEVVIQKDLKIDRQFKSKKSRLIPALLMYLQNSPLFFSDFLLPVDLFQLHFHDAFFNFGDAFLQIAGFSRFQCGF